MYYCTNRWLALCFCVLASAAMAAAGPISPRDSAALSMPFPFDTTVCSVCDRVPRDSSRIRLLRYGISIYFRWLDHPAACPTTQEADFALQLSQPLPQGAPPLVLKHIAGDCFTFTYEYHLDREYLVPIDSISLYMRVLAADSVTLQVRLDTLSTVLAAIGRRAARGLASPGRLMPRLVVATHSRGHGVSRAFVSIADGSMHDLRGVMLRR